MASHAVRATIGKMAPYFKTKAYDSPSGQFKDISLDEFKGKWLLLFFYPLDFTFVCPTEIVEFSNQAAKFRNANCQIVGCSIDSHFVHREWTLKPKSEGGLGKIDIPLLADMNHEIADKYGVLNDAGIANRGTFLVDHNQILRHASINDLGVGRNVDEYYRTLEAFQHLEKHGEVCPANWKKDTMAMKPELGNPKLNEYWKNVHDKK